MTSVESIYLTEVVMHTEGGSRTSIDFLRSRDRTAFDEFCYRAASDYYFFYDGADSRKKAASWYEKVLESKNLTEQQLKVADSLYKIGNYYASLGTNAGKYDFANQGSSYLDYWNDLVQITEGNLMETTGHAYVALGLYKNMAVEIYSCAPQFKEAGITQKEMQEQLDNIDMRLKKIQPEDGEDRKEMEKIRLSVEKAEKILESTFVAAGE